MNNMNDDGGGTRRARHPRHRRREQAGLAMGHYLKTQGREILILDAHSESETPGGSAGTR